VSKVNAFLEQVRHRQRGLKSGRVYLENAPFVAGEILHVDGGQSAGH
jgi:hypothetical protein